jgi:hypothetical protein
MAKYYVDRTHGLTGVPDAQAWGQGVVWDELSGAVSPDQRPMPALLQGSCGLALTDVL